SLVRAAVDEPDETPDTLARTVVQPERGERRGFESIHALAQPTQDGDVRPRLQEPRKLRAVPADHARALHADVPHAPALALAQHGEVQRHAVVAVAADDARLHDGAVAVHGVAGDDDLLALVAVEVAQVGAVEQLAEERDE